MDKPIPYDVLVTDIQAMDSVDAANLQQNDNRAAIAQQWISVTERLPERDKEVLLIVHGWEDRLYYTGCLHRQEAERSWLTGIESKASDWKIWGFSYLRDPIVTHWMPLPNPPKGE